MVCKTIKSEKVSHALFCCRTVAGVRFGGSSQVTGPGNDEQPLSPQKSWKKRMSQG